MSINRIKSQTAGFAEWYASVIEHARLAKHSNVKGTILFLPKGWAIWELIRQLVDAEFQQLGIENVAFPALIDYVDLAIEKAHLSGFQPELFMVSTSDENVDHRPLVLRPTSEVIFCNYFKAMVASYADLPIKINQWTNVWRVEKNTKPFLRTSEFHWQEMHSVHASAVEAAAFARRLIDVYEHVVNDYLLIPTLKGEKTVGERFAGANHTFTIEALMQDGQVLQCGTAHDLGDNFTKVFDIRYQSETNERLLTYSTSAGVSTRLIGGLIMTHADDYGLVLPPPVAPVQVMIVTVDQQTSVVQQALMLQVMLKQIMPTLRVKVDDSTKTIGYKINEQEMGGTPVVIIVGAQELLHQTVMVYRRDQRAKEQVSLGDLVTYVVDLLAAVKANIYAKAKQRLDAGIVTCAAKAELITAVNQGKIALAPWCGELAMEHDLKQQTGISPRCILAEVTEGTCFWSQKPAKQQVYFARAY